MTALTGQVPRVVGTDLTSANPTATTGDTVPVGSKVLVSNGSGSSITVTVVVPGNDTYGSARPDFTKTVAAGALTQLGPFPNDLADPATGLVTVICSSVSSVKLYVLAS